LVATSFGFRWVFNQTIYRDKKVVSDGIAFSCAASPDLAAALQWSQDPHNY
jgi:hypothetical protein